MPESITEWVDSAPPAMRKDPGQYVCRWKPFSVVAILSSALLWGGGFGLARGGGVAGAVGYVLVCAVVGLMFTLASMAWGAVISLTEDPRCGAMFVVFPPYVFYYAVTRWRWMSQPSILFLCGLGLAVGGILAGKSLLPE